MKHLTDLQEVWAVARGHQRSVKARMGFSPGVTQPGRIARLTLRRAEQPVMGGNEALLPTYIARGDRSPQAHALDLDTDLGQIVQFRAGDGRGPEAPLRLRYHQAFRGQP